jgi:hypothetical protein
MRTSFSFGVVCAWALTPKVRTAAKRVEMMLLSFMVFFLLKLKKN